MEYLFKKELNNVLVTCYVTGFTVLEVVISAALASLLLAALLRFLVASYPVSKVTWLQANSNETARVQLKRLAMQIRDVRTSQAGDYPLQEMLPQKIIFFADVDGDAVVERVRYELEGTNLTRGIIEPSGDPPQYDTAAEKTAIVARSIQNGMQAVFTYYTGNYPADPTALTPVDVTEVKYIEFYLSIDADPAQDPPPVEVRSQVQLRNLKTNLGETSI